MSLIIQKFGGSSVADIERIQNVARIVSKARQEGHAVVAVVSAMYGETDRLIKLAQTISDSNLREYDALISTGEQISAALLSMVLQERNCPARSYTAAQIRLHTTNEHKKSTHCGYRSGNFVSRFASWLCSCCCWFSRD